MDAARGQATHRHSTGHVRSLMVGHGFDGVSTFIRCHRRPEPRGVRIGYEDPNDIPDLVTAATTNASGDNPRLQVRGRRRSGHRGACVAAPMAPLLRSIRGGGK
jgi:hypothetical protein